MDLTRSRPRRGTPRLGYPGSRRPGYSTPGLLDATGYSTPGVTRRDGLLDGTGYSTPGVLGAIDVIDARVLAGRAWPYSSGSGHAAARMIFAARTALGTGVTAVSS